MPPSPLCYSFKAVTLLTGITLMVLGILMLAKVKILPDRFFKDNVTLKTKVAWGTVALGVIVKMIGIGLLCCKNTPEKESPTPSSNPSTSKQQKDLSTDSKAIMAEGFIQQEPQSIEGLLKKGRIEEAIVLFNELYLKEHEKRHTGDGWENYLFCEKWDQYRIPMLKMLIQDEKYNPNVIVILASYLGRKDRTLYYDLFINYFCAHCSTERIKNLIDAINHEILQEYLLFALAKKFFLEDQTNEALTLFKTIKPKQYYTYKASSERDNYLLRTLIILLLNDEKLSQEKYKEMIFLIRDHCDQRQQTELVERVETMGPHPNDRSLVSLFLCTLAHIDDPEFHKESLPIFRTLPMPCAKYLCQEIGFFPDIAMTKKTLSILYEFFTDSQDREVVTQHLQSLV